ncbi:unnamed protein product, partial [Symbiodinium sp. KB8]
ELEINENDRAWASGIAQNHWAVHRQDLLAESQDVDLQCVVEEIMGFFVAPVSGWYSFLTWGQLHQEVWLSTSEVERVAKRLDYTGCRCWLMFYKTLEIVFHLASIRLMRVLIEKKLDILRKVFSNLLRALRIPQPSVASLDCLRCDTAPLFPVTLKRSGGRRRNVYTGCSIFYNYRDHPDPQRAHVGTNISDRLGIRTPSEKAVRLQKGALFGRPPDLHFLKGFHSGFIVWGSGFRFRVWGLGFRAQV